MIKKFSKLLVFSLIILTIISSFSICFADEADTATPTSVDATEATTTTETETNGEETQNIYNGDLYMFNTTIVMDKLVDGNVYLMGNNITISGQVNGNLFVLGNNITFDNCYVRYSIYACANNIYYNCACNDLYATVSNKLEMTYDSYVVRDVKALANNTVFKAAIGRDVDLKTNSIDFGLDTDENKLPIIYGNLRYSANKELQSLTDKGIVEGEVTYSKATENSNTSSTKSIFSILLGFLTVVVTTLVLYALLKNCKSESIEKLKNSNSILGALKALGIGILTVLVAIIAIILLFISSVGSQLALVLIAVLFIVGIFSMPIVSIFVTDILKPLLKVEKTIIYYVVLALVVIILHGITLIPYVGGVVSIIIFFLGYGLIVNGFLPKKELTPEQLEEKANKKAEKEKAKLEKAERKAEKKAEKKSEKNISEE